MRSLMRCTDNAAISSRYAIADSNSFLKLVMRYWKLERNVVALNRAAAAVIAFRKIVNMDYG